MTAIVIFGSITAIVIYTTSVRHKERMALIEKGIQPFPRLDKPPKKVGGKALLLGLFSLALGMTMIINTFFLQHHIDTGMLTAALLCQFVGIALLGYWKLTESERKLDQKLYEESFNYALGNTGDTDI
ncbi:MAG: hypothetical protein JXB48_09380 [Candidatus Latescibacteria bacterium]|nr:hypothetical protein [Candidatus Latescibacterota bacterium]